jgi:nucleoporin POM152
VVKHTLWDANAAIPVDQSGIYEIVSVHDTCPGVVDPNANTFEVAWISRPNLAIKDATLQADGPNGYRKPAVCVGDESVVAVAFSGNPPYLLKYQQKSELLRGSVAVSNKQISAAIGSASVQMDTSKAGEYTYTFNELSDDRYTHDRKRFQPLIVRQQVYALPSARFSNPGTTYRHCKNEEGGEQNIPITLEGSPPFSLEIGIMHHGNSKPDMVRLRDIQSTSFSWNMARRGFGLGTHSISIRKVKDSRGCEQILEEDSSAVRVMVSDPPTIIPLESQTDYCVGDHVSYSLSGQPPFDVFYRFQGRERKARATTTAFRRIAEQPGEFTITALSDNASGKCKAEKNITKIIHPMPTVKISKGKTSVVDIHEGGDVEILFEFTGTPPFEFT